jgi:hypothetical protein
VLHREGHARLDVVRTERVRVLDAITHQLQLATIELRQQIRQIRTVLRRIVRGSRPAGTPPLVRGMGVVHVHRRRGRRRRSRGGVGRVTERQVVQQLQLRQRLLHLRAALK